MLNYSLSRLYESVKFSPTHTNHIVLTENFKYKDVEVPKGFVSDGATVPYVAKFIGITRFKAKYLPAVILHDYLCDKEKYAYADAVFEDCLYKIEKSYKTWLMVKTVRVYHKIRYGIKLK